MDGNKLNVISPCKHLLWHPPLLSWHLFIDIKIWYAEMMVVLSMATTSYIPVGRQED